MRPLPAPRATSQRYSRCRRLLLFTVGFGTVGCPVAIHCRSISRLSAGWSRGTMCPALATRTNDSGPTRLNVPPAQAWTGALRAAGSGRQRQAQAGWLQRAPRELGR